MAIPRTIHQTAPDLRLREPLRGYRRRLLDLHPGWELRLYDDAECRNLLRRRLPYLLPPTTTSAPGAGRAPPAHRRGPRPARGSPRP